MKLEETTADFFYSRPEIYLKCIKAGAKYLEKEPYPKNDQDIKFSYGYHPERETSRERWWKEAIKPIKQDLKDHFGSGFTKMIRLIYITLADEGNTAIKNVQQFISTGTCEQYEAFNDAPDSANAGGQFVNTPKCTDCGAPLTKEEIETYGDVCEACSFDFGKDRHYDGPDVADLYDSIIKEGTNTKKKNFIDIKGDKAKLDWERPEIEKIGFGKIKESEEKIVDAFEDFCWQIYNGGVEQPIALNTHYYERIVQIINTYGEKNLLTLIHQEKFIPEDIIENFDQFIKDVCTVCEAVNNTQFYTDCDECGGSGVCYYEDDEGNSEEEYCSNCGGDGSVECQVGEIDYPEHIKPALKPYAQQAWDRLESLDFNLMKVAFKEN